MTPRDVTIQGSAVVQGRVHVPADKAICHRAALIAALGEGAMRILPWPAGEDCAATLNVLRQLGVSISRAKEEGGVDAITVRGVGLAGLRAPSGDLRCGESGTTMRLLAGLLAGQPFASRLIGAPSLTRRPMMRIVQPLNRMGATCRGASVDHELYPPLVIEGHHPLTGGTHELVTASAQVKSAILLAGLYADGPTTVIEPVATRDHTERLLAHVGVSVTRADRAVIVEPPRGPLRVPRELRVPGDFSSAAFFIVAATVLPGAHLVLEHVSLNPSRCHLLTVLRRMGAAIQSTVEGQEWEPRGTVTVDAAPLRGIVIEPGEAAAMIDELPIVMVAACAARGKTVLQGLQELRVKEADRVESMTTGLRRMGASLTQVHPKMAKEEVHLMGGPLRAAVVESFGDHRTAMSLAVAGLRAQGQTQIRGAACVAKSFGEFFEVLASVTRH